MSPDARRMAPHAAAATRRAEERGPELALPIAIGRGLVALGALLRIARTLANRSLWGGEGALAIHVVESEPGQHFWVVTLHPPHWRSEPERDAIAAALGAIAERVETLEGDRAEASLWRVTRGRPARCSKAPSSRHRAV